MNGLPISLIYEVTKLSYVLCEVTVYAVVRYMVLLLTWLPIQSLLNKLRRVTTSTKFNVFFNLKYSFND
jgi:hypothetical protein